jgi:hypothetical protein
VFGQSRLRLFDRQRQIIHSQQHSDATHALRNLYRLPFKNTAANGGIDRFTEYGWPCIGTLSA